MSKSKKAKIGKLIKPKRRKNMIASNRNKSKKYS